MTANLGFAEGSPEPFQVMPALTDAEFVALKESLRAHGCLAAIEYDEDGAVLDGHHRLRALRELGVTSHPRVIRAGLGGHAEKVAHALALNVHRRHLRRLERLRRTKPADEAREALEGQPGVPGVGDIRHCDIADLHIPPDTVDLILTDPPFLRADFEPGGPWDVLGQQAVRWLKPGGLLLAHCAHLHLARAISLLSRYETDGLDYWWIYAITFPGGGTGRQVRSRAIAAAWRPVLAYRKAGGPSVPRYSADPVVGGGREKDSAHPWQQGVAEAVTFVDRLTTPGALIVDPFVGSGTIPVAALSLEGRRVIAADIDPAYVALAQRRIAEALGGTKT